MKTSIRVAGAAALAAALSACQAVNYGPPPIQQQQQPRDSVQGEWVDPNGIVSIFSNGNFETRTTDTNDLLADGSYRFSSDRLVEINLTSRVRGTQSTVNCAIISSTQLNCTADSGSQFSLARRSAG